MTKKEKIIEKEISLCPNCHCMTKTIKGKIGIKRCGKCGEFK